MQPPPTTSSSARFDLAKTQRDVRDCIPLLLLLAMLSLMSVSFFTYAICLTVIGIYWGAPPLVRLRWPTFMRTDFLDGLRVNAGASMSLVAATTALLLQSHNPSISLAIKAHSEFYSRPLVRLLRTYLCVELLLNGSSKEKEQTASWLRWIHRHIEGSISAEMRKELGIPEEIEKYGYMNELKAYIMQTLTWAVISFQDRFGQRLSGQAKDTIVLEYTCAGMRLGVPQSMLTATYDDFLVSFNRRLDRLDAGYELSGTIMHNIEASIISSKKHWVTGLLVRTAFMIGHSLLPDRVKCKYQLNTLKSRKARITQRALCASLWLIYPFLVLIPLRGLMCLLLVLEPQLRPTFRSSLQMVHSMDVIQDKPVISKPNGTQTVSAPPNYLAWLASGRQRPAMMQLILVRTLEQQLQSDSWINAIRVWSAYPLTIAETCAKCGLRSVQETVTTWRSQFKESSLFHSGREVKLLVHVGIIIDGNRRYARQRGQHASVGHAQGAATASRFLEWWIKHLPSTAGYAPSMQPKYLTWFVFSAENFSRSDEEQKSLFEILALEFKSLAFTSLLHLFRIRVRFIGGDRHRFPLELRETMAMVEDITSLYDGVFLQLAVGYGGRQEVVSAVQSLVAQGTEITERNIGMETYCAQRGIPPVNFIIRTSERRTSGFFLWDTQAAELHFIDKLWPEITEMDWLQALDGFSKREIRGGR
ncbi:putative undecaprenyl diphosphate synthase-domain-containing protein [Mycena olivaceomarginata]|nr:putative undecaprenyl diphosphate synthase-domain-containing protein [Mycena olivaceomarginata]